MKDVSFLPQAEEQIAGWLKGVKFRRRLLGGLDERDVWRKIGELNELYRQALAAERARCDALIAERDGAKTAERRRRGDAD